MKITQTADKSSTLYSSQFEEHYHSVNGAVSESLHIFIDAGFNFIDKNEINVLEIGFGTGLNAILTYEQAKLSEKIIFYDAIELYPAEFDVIKKLNFHETANINNEVFLQMHKLSWNEKHKITQDFIFRKVQNDLLKIDFANKYDLIYFDAFSPETQPEMWTEKVFTKIYNSMNTGGILTTYSSKGIVKQALRNSGFTVKRLPGPKGKRHILRAVK